MKYIDKNPMAVGVFEEIYKRYNKRELVHPDPLEFLYEYPDIRDREITGLIASSLAYGRVAQILKSVSKVLSVMGPSPYDFLTGTKMPDIAGSFRGFRHRFHGGSDIVSLLAGMKGVLERHGSLEACFMSALKDAKGETVGALSTFVEELSVCGACNMLSAPGKGSACKRLNLFLRWMVRRDDVDPGGWRGVDRAKLIVPLDTHMHKIGLKLKFTKRRQANMRTALEITSGFSEYSPEDPVKYDFALTRFGIRRDMDMGSLDKIFCRAP